jgi:hypothetical protein
MAIPEHDQYVKLMKQYRRNKKSFNKINSAISNRQKKRIKRKNTMYYAGDVFLESKSRLKGIELGYNRLIDFYKELFGPYYRKWDKYKC